MNPPPFRLTHYRARASALLREPKRLLQLGSRASAKLDGVAGNPQLNAVREHLSSMLALLKAWVSGEYRDVSQTALLSIAAAVLYFLTPLDAIPDFLLGMGLIDDVAVIGFVLRQIQTELESFRRWQAAGKGDAANHQNDS